MPGAEAGVEPEPDARARMAAELVGRVQAGAAGAEAELVARYRRGVRFVLLQRANDPALADDLEQETWRLVLQKVRAGEPREPEKLPGFIQGVAKNLFLAHLRRQAQRPGEPVERSGPLRDPSPGPLALALRSESARLVRRLLAELEPPRDREILFRFYLAEEPKERICADLGLSSLHFNRVIHRARNRFKALLEASGAAVAVTGRRPP